MSGGIEKESWILDRQLKRGRADEEPRWIVTNSLGKARGGEGFESSRKFNLGFQKQSTNRPIEPNR